MKYFVVKKINSETLEKVTNAYDRIMIAAKWAGWEEVTSPDDFDDETVVISLGGDGTMLYAAKLAARKSCPVVGVDLGHRGFLTDFSVDEICDAIVHRNLMSGPMDTRSLLAVDVPGMETPQLAMNDIVIANAASGEWSEYSLRINGRRAGKHKSDSVIISTATGSTAYALSVNGAIMDPSVDTIQIVPVAAISPVSSIRPLIVAPDSTIDVLLKTTKGVKYTIRSDGQIVHTIEGTGNAVNITVIRSHLRVNIERKKGWSFYSTLKTKLGWAEDR